MDRNGDVWLTAKEVADRLGCDLSWVHALCRQGELPGARKLSGGRTSAWIIPQSAVEAYEKKTGRSSG